MVQSTISRTKPYKPIAKGTYRNSWNVHKHSTGAVLGNSTLQARFVEIGRLPGRAPPLKPIYEWVKTKKLGAKSLRKKRKKRSRPKREKGAEGAAASGKPKKLNTKRALAAMRADLMIAKMVRIKIGREGTPARYPLKRTLPRMERFLVKDLRKKVKAARAPR
jgi:hypothetical protein